MTFSIKKLSSILRPLLDEQGANASVALILKLREGRLYALFVRRVQNFSDPWSGQMALPGGKREAMDKDLKETVIREVLEETGIDLADHCSFLGVMSIFQSIPKPDIKVLPFIVLIESEPTVRLNAKELEEYLWIPLEELITNRAKAKLSFGEVPAFIVGNTVIWGLTYRIVESLIKSLKAETPGRHCH